MQKRWLWPAALAAALTLVAAGCGGEGEQQGQQQGQGQPAAEQVISVNWGTEPPSLDPGLATDTTSSNILLNIMDPLVKLDGDLNAVPNAAESWDISQDGKTYTFHLRDDLKWTNGDPTTAQDFVYSWQRTVSPELAADYAYQFFGIVGAEDYNGCDPKKDDCDALKDKLGVKAVDDKTLEVTLVSPQPWFLQQLSHHSFLAVNQKAVEQFGDKWTEAENIVTNGPFRLARWQHDSRIDLVKWDEWRDAADVSLTRVNGRMITDGTTAVQAFEAGEVDADVGNLPPAEMPRLKTLPTYQQYPALGTYYYGVNVKNITDVKQRRAMALAIDRQTIIDNIAQADQLPATGFTPKGMAGFDALNPNSQWLPAQGDIDQAKQLMSQVQNPKKDITLFINDAAGHKEIAVAVQDMWKDLGISVTIKQQEWAQYLEFLGPPPDKSVDVYRLGWVGDFPDAINFLDLWTCKSGNNNTNFCDKRYDELTNEVKTGNLDQDARNDHYKQLEDIMYGPDGQMPVIPIYWYTYVGLEKENIKDTFNQDSLSGFVDLTKVKVAS
jgi:oligopeptide transport system substrate-binding protein